jgi:hypothetical protein
MYTELVLGLELTEDKGVLDILKFMLDVNSKPENKPDGDYSHPFFSTQRWWWMLNSDSYYFDGKTDSKLIIDDCTGHTYYHLNVRCNLKNYTNEIEEFLDWLCPYIRSYGFLGYMRYEEYNDPTLIYKRDDRIVFKD